MAKTMKSSVIKTLVVQLTKDNIQEIDIDYNLFEDPFMEAATRAVEKSKGDRGSLIRPITTIWEKDNAKKCGMYNSYWVLINAACYKKAELLRLKFKAQSNIDLAKEPVSATQKKTKK